MRRILLITMAVISFQLFALEELVATVDRNPVLANESFVLTVTADDSVNRDEIDFSALLDQFIVGRTQVSQQTQMVNFKTNRTTTWTTTLIAPKPGVYVIPGFSINGKRSQPIKVEVLKAGSDSATSNQPEVFLRSELNTSSLYPQQQGVMTTRLYLSVNLESGSLSEPKADSISFEQIGKDSDRMEILDGKRYRVIERQYAFSCSMPGKHSIQSPHFSGSVSKGMRRSIFNSSRPVQALSEPVSVECKNMPANAPTPWLVAELVSIEGNLENKTWRVGEPVTRTITLTAAGTTADAIPDIHPGYPTSFNSYPDKPQLKNSFRGATSIVQKQQSTALIPTKAGSFTLPSVAVQWWNAKTHRLETATLPAEKIEVEAAAQIISQAPAMSPELTNPESGEKVVINADLSWLTLLFGGLWLATLTGWYFHTRRFKQKKPIVSVEASSAASNEKQQWQTLNTAFNSQEQQQVEAALQSWIKTVEAETGGKVTSKVLTEAMDEMYASRFSATPVSWSSDKLKSAVTAIRAELMQKPNKDKGLKPLYPEL